MANAISALRVPYVRSKADRKEQFGLGVEPTSGPRSSGASIDKGLAVLG